MSKIDLRKSYKLLRSYLFGYLQPSFSQLGEDSVLWWLFNERHAGFYVDIGCHHPMRFSNTARLHLYNQWHGINVDVDERAIEAFRVARPSDTNLCVAVGNAPGRRLAAFFEEGAVNSLLPSAAQDPSWVGLLREERLVDVETLSAILDRHLPPGQTIDLLNVDVEGLDYEVLSSNDWLRYRPQVIAVEVHGFDLAVPKDHETFRYLSDMGFRLISHVGVTSIYRSSS